MGEVKFREGDIVRLTDECLTDEGTVVELRQNMHPVWAVRWHSDGRVGRWFAENELLLLRRPVRVGDRLRHKDGASWYVVDDTTLIDAPTWAQSWTHADGTAIDPPTPVATKQPESRAVLDGPGNEPVGWTVGAGGGGGAACSAAGGGATGTAGSLGGACGGGGGAGSNGSSIRQIQTGFATPKDVEAYFGVAVDDPKSAGTEFKFVTVSARGESKKFGQTIRPGSVTLQFVKKPDGDPCAGELLLARTIFKTDPAVIAIVTERSDCRRVRDIRTCERLQSEGRPVVNVLAFIESDDRKAYDRAMQIAWERNEGGLATAAKKRAAEIVAELRKPAS